MDPVALYDVLNCASMALLHAEGSNLPMAETAFLEATVAAPEAFRAGPLADALNLILGAVRDFTSGVTA